LTINRIVAGSVRFEQRNRDCRHGGWVIDCRFEGIMSNLAGNLRRGGLQGTWCGLASFAAVEAMATLGFDFLVLDLQHSEICQPQVPSLLGAAAAANIPAVVRAPSNDHHAINWLCDQGAAGVLVPMVNSSAEARRAVEAAKYPPMGRRSFGPLRASRYGTALGEYMDDPDSHTALIVQIEHAAAIDEVGRIAAMPGIDAVFMGPNDIAFSMLAPGEKMQGDSGQWSAFARTPRVLDLCRSAMRACQAAEVPFGMTAADGAEARQWLAEGAHFATFGSDVAFLRAGARCIRGTAV
jgi:2-keto-3-deoxy-L-rhamnonate aldolase RhmA